MISNCIHQKLGTSACVSSIQCDTDFLNFEDIRSKLNIQSKDLFKQYIKEVYKDIAERDETGKRNGITKLTFIEYINIPLFICESIFNALDKDKDGFLNFLELEQGLTLLYLGGFKEVLKLIFDIYDSDLDGYIRKEDVRLLLSYLPPKSISIAAYEHQIDSQMKIKEIVDITFSGFTDLNYNDYLNIIEAKNSDSFVHLICYLYDKKVFNHENIRSIEKKKDLRSNLVSTPNSFLLSPIFPVQVTANPKLATPKHYALSSTESYLGRKHKNSISRLIGRPTETPDLFDQFNFEASITDRPISEVSEYEMLAKIHNELSLKSSEENIINNMTPNCFDSPSTFKQSISTRRDTIDDYSQFSLDLTDLEMPFLLESEYQQQVSETFEGWIYKITENSKLKKFWLVLKYRDIFYFKNEMKDELSGLHSLVGCSVKDGNPKIIGDKKLYSFSITFKSKTSYYYSEDRDTCINWKKNIRKAIGHKCLFDTYEINEDIGRGKFGVVKLGIHKLNKSKVAIKTIKKENLKSKQDHELIKVEIDIMKICTHPNIINLVDHFENNEYMFIVMDYINGGTLNNYVRNFYNGSNNSRRLPEDIVAYLMKQLAQGLKYLHSFGIIHRDIKPDNLMITGKSSDTKLKIMDFGLSKMLHYGEKVADGFGTLSFVAPEVLQRKPYDFKVDIWSMGVTIFNLISGEFPFDDAKDDQKSIATNITSSRLVFKSAVWKTISAEAKDLISKCLIKNPEKRLTINEFLESDWIKSRIPEAFPSS